MAVNPILPSLRDHELRFILDDVQSRMIFVPNEFRGHDYPGMLIRVIGGLAEPPEVVVVRGSEPRPPSELLTLTMPGQATRPVPTPGPPAAVDDILTRGPEISEVR